MEVKNAYHPTEEGWRLSYADRPTGTANALSLGTDNEVGMVIDNGRLIVEPYRRPQYSLAELLAQCDPNAEISAEEREWLDAPATGQEEI